MYLHFCEKFGPSGDEPTVDHSWSRADQFYARYPIEGKGDYAWAHPSISRRKPTFRDLANAVDAGSEFLETYYEFATSKTHGRFILGFNGIRPARVAVIGGDTFSSAGIDSVLEFTIPLFATVIDNAIAPTATEEQERILHIVRIEIKRLTDEIASIRSADPEK